MKKIGKVVGLALGVLVVLYGMFRLGVHVVQYPPAPHVKEGKIHIACVGDSITYGAGVLGHRRSQSYPAYLQENLGEKYQVLNYGLSGRTLMDEGDVPYRSEKLYQKSLDAKADIYLLMLGTNDAAPAFVQDIPTSQQPTAFLQSATQIIQSYRNLSSKPDIFVMTSVQVLTQNSRKRLLETVFMPLQKQAAKDNSCNLIDIFAQTGNIETLYSDGLHLTDDGYRYLAGLVLNGIVDHYGFTK